MNNLKLYLSLFIIVAIISINCSKSNKISDQCNSDKIDLLLKDIFRKKYLFKILNHFYDQDSSVIFNYVSAKNFTIPNRDYYIRDSIKLRKIDTSEFLNKNGANKIGLNLLEINNDSSYLKLTISYAYNKVLLSESTYRLQFSPDNCKWTAIDSTFWEY